MNSARLFLDEGSTETVMICFIQQWTYSHIARTSARYSQLACCAILQSASHTKQTLDTTVRHFDYGTNGTPNKLDAKHTDTGRH
jgi:hypothetical protein